MLSRLWNLFRRKRLDTELDIELGHHLELLEAEHREHGLSPHEARLAARRDFGALAQVQEAYRDQRGIPMLETLWRDIRFGVRSMWRTPVVTLTVIATMAVGIGANTAVFSVIDGVLLKPLPYPESDRLITVAHAAPGIVLSDSADVGSSLFLYFTEREQNRTLEGVGLVGMATATVTGQGEPEQVRRLYVTDDVLPLLRIEPQLGRYFSPTDDAPGSPNTAVLTYGYWQRHFGGDPAVIGRNLTMDGESAEIIGVMPQEFSVVGFGAQPDVISPSRFNRTQVTVGGYFRRSVARLKPGVTLEQASADIRRLIPVAIDGFPLGPGTTRQQVESARLTPALRPLKQDVVGNAGSVLWVLMGTIAMVLLIACANVANLILVRTEGRRQELSIRAALGAGWGRIARELLTESAVLGLAGGILGVGFAYVALRVLLAMAPANLPRAEEIGIDSTVLLFTLGLSIFSGLLFGAIPVIRYARPKLIAALHASGRLSSTSRERLRARSVLVVVQVAMALMLLISAGLMIRTFREMSNVNPGFARPGEVQTVALSITEASVRDPEAALQRQKEILDRLAAVPGVRSVAYTNAVPMGGGFTADLLVIEGRAFDERNPPKGRQFRFISPGLFGTLGIPMVAGRDLDWTDLYERRPVVLISQNLARQEWGSADAALGKRLRGASTADQWREIVGVVGDVRDWGLSRPLTEIVYVPVMAEGIFNTPTFLMRYVTYVVRSTRAASPSFIDEIRQSIWAVDPNLPLINLRTMGDFVDDSLATTSFALVMLGIAGAMALLLGLLGIYGVVSYAVAQRTREVGVRIAMGAQIGEVRRLFLRQGLVLTGVGVVLGLAGAAAVTRSMTALLFGVSPLDPITYAAVSLVLVVAALLATYLPSRRATRIDPIEALRSE